MQAYKNKGEKYQLFWPSKRSEFVRMAARFGATIVPFGGIGSEDAVEVLLDPKQLRALPIVGAQLEQRAKSQIPSARQ